MPLHRGKVATKPEILSVRPLTREDLGLLLEKTVGSDGRPISGAVKRFRDPHHRVARLFASGLGLAEVVARSGYSYNRVSQLHADPAFQELIASKRKRVDERLEEAIDEVVQEGLEQIRIGQRMVREQLEEADENEVPIPLRTLITLNADNMDRFGYGKRQTNLNVNADFASLLEKAIQRSGKTIEAMVIPSPRLDPPRESLPLASEESPIEARPIPPVPQSPERPSRLPAQGPQSAPIRRRAIA